MDLTTYLAETAFIDYRNPEVISLAERVCAGGGSPKDRAIKLYYAVRDEIRYDPYDVRYSAEAMKASTVIRKGKGFCITKAVVLAAVGRQQGIPTRLGFADVQNHLTTARLRARMGSDIFLYHGYTEFFLDHRWVKATPAFNLSLCERFQVRPLEFNGEEDSIFHEFNTLGQKHMQYVRDHGTFADLPFTEILTVFQKEYPAMFAQTADSVNDDFHAEAEQEQRQG
jgi:transglutaminase-like putative cysteine protease